MSWVIQRWPLDEMRVTSPFGERIHPITGEKQFHNGVDLGADQFTELFPVVPGTVLTVAEDEISGLYVVYEDDDGHRYGYAHTSAVLLGKGDHVDPSMPIALIGSTGRSTGPHLHWTVREKKNGAYVDPMTLDVASGPDGAALLAALAVVGAALGSDDSTITEADVWDRIAELQHAVQRLTVEAMSTVMVSSAAEAHSNLVELLTRELSDDADEPGVLVWLIDQGRMLDAYNMSTRWLNLVNEVTGEVAQYGMATAVVDLVIAVIDDVRDAANAATSSGVLGLVGLVLGALLFR